MPCKKLQVGKKSVDCFILSILAAVLAIMLSGIPALAAEPTVADLLQEIQRLRQEVNDLRGKVTDVEKRDVKTQEKVAAVEKTAATAKEATDKVAKKSLRDRINWGGELRLRIMSERGEASRGFYGAGQPTTDRLDKNELSFPTRLRLNMNAEVVPDFLDFYGRLTINKRWGQYANWPDQDPLDNPNAFHAGIGGDISLRVEHAYAKFNASRLNSNIYIGRLAAMDGPPSRQNAPFPRVFIDSELDGAMWEWKLPETQLSKMETPYAVDAKGTEKYPLGKGPLSSYGKKLSEGNNLLVAYAKYREEGFTNPGGSASEALLGFNGRGPDSDVYILQGQVKLTKDTEFILSGAYIPNFYMPRTSYDTAGTFKWSETLTSSDLLKRITIPFFTANYSVWGGYLDTQIWKFQVYGGLYFDNLDIPSFQFTRESRTAINTSSFTTSTGYTKTTVNSPGISNNGHSWWLGMNTGDIIAPNQQFTFEYFRGDGGWINPLNDRGYRRKGTPLYAANNYFFNPTSGTSTFFGSDVVAGYYTCDASIVDTYYDYYYTPALRFRLGYMYFKFNSVDITSPIGASRYEKHYWPYFEINLSW